MLGGSLSRSYTPLRSVTFADLKGWALDDHAAAFAAFHRSAERMAMPPSDGALGVTGAGLQRVARLALEWGNTLTRDAARRFFEANFQAVAVQPADGAGFLTGYFEPEVDGSRVPTERFRYPLYRRPDDLVDVTDANRPAGLDETYDFARATREGLVPYHDRGEIEDGAFDGWGLELVFLADPIDAFFIHVQGSASIRLPDGARMRVCYAGKAGHPYTSIGKRLIERGVFTADTMTLATLRNWLAANRAAGAMLMRENRSFVFFRELAADSLNADLGAIAAAGVQITPGRSLAVDHRLHAYGTPIWLDAVLPLGPAGEMGPFRRLMIAQDTGSAIVGPARADIFLGSGDHAGAAAGRLRHAPVAFVMLQPI